MSICGKNRVSDISAEFSSKKFEDSCLPTRVSRFSSWSLLISYSPLLIKQIKHNTYYFGDKLLIFSLEF